MTEKPGIYAIRHLESGKVYIGSASNISKRWSRHRKDLRSGAHANVHLQAAWTKYGEDAFVFEMVELTGELDVREQFWSDHMECVNPDKGYNYCPTARSSLGVKRGPQTEEQRRRKGSISYRMLAEGYGVVQSVIYDIVVRNTWKHVE